MIPDVGYDVLPSDVDSEGNDCPNGCADGSLVIDVYPFDATHATFEYSCTSCGYYALNDRRFQ